MMKKKVLSLVIAMVFGILTTVISGCAANRVDLVDSGVLSLTQQSTGKVYIAWSGAYEQDDGFVITGVLRRRDHVGLPIKTHVDVTILSPDGTILDEARSSDVCVSRRITGRSYLSFERFKVRFPNVPAKGSSVRLVSHSGQHDDATKL
jgi:hypothetical protein